MRAHARDSCRHRIHQNRARIGRRSSRDIDPGAVERVPAPTESRACFVCKRSISRHLPPVIGFDPLRREQQTPRPLLPCTPPPLNSISACADTQALRASDSAPSNRLANSISAASPRARTSARIEETTSEISGSDFALSFQQRCEFPLKPGCLRIQAPCHSASRHVVLKGFKRAVKPVCWRVRCWRGNCRANSSDFKIVRRPCNGRAGLSQVGQAGIDAFNA